MVARDRDYDSVRSQSASRSRSRTRSNPSSGRSLNPIPHLPYSISRFLGHRPEIKPPYEPLPFPPFSWLRYIDLKYEVWLTSCIGSFVGLLLVEAIMTTQTVFRDVWHSPIIMASLGATAVLIYGVMDSPLSQPRNVLGGQVFSAIVAVCITRLFALKSGYGTRLGNDEFHRDVFVNGPLSMSLALLVQFITGTVHPPGGATALAFATEADAEALSWRYIAVILCSTLTMFGWALIINNVGRRRYPLYWWNSGPPATISLPVLPLLNPSRADPKPKPEEPEEPELQTSTQESSMPNASADGTVAGVQPDWMIRVEDPLRQAEDGGRTLESMDMEQEYRAGGHVHLHHVHTRAQ